MLSIYIQNKVYILIPEYSCFDWKVTVDVHYLYLIFYYTDIIKENWQTLVCVMSA